MDVMVGELLEDMVEEQAGFMGTVAIEEAYNAEHELESEHAFKDDAERAVWDKVLIERLMDTFINDFVEQEEKKLV